MPSSTTDFVFSGFRKTTDFGFVGWRVYITQLYQTAVNESSLTTAQECLLCVRGQFYREPSQSLIFLLRCFRYMLMFSTFKFGFDLCRRELYIATPISSSLDTKTNFHIPCQKFRGYIFNANRSHERYQCLNRLWGFMPRARRELCAIGRV